MRFLIAQLFIVFSLMVPANADTASDPFARDILILAEWFEGDFDNEEQVWFHRRSGAKGAVPTRIHTSHVRIELPALGEHVFYVEEYTDNEPAKVVRKRVVSFSSDTEANAIRLKQGFLKSGAQLNKSDVSSGNSLGLRASDVFFLGGCDVFLKRRADQFEGGMKPRACVFGEGADRRYSVHDLIISETKYWRTDATYRISDGSFFKGTPPGKPSEMRKADWFNCDFYFYGADRKEEQSVKGLRVHNQGGVGRAVRNSDGQAFEILLRNKEYPYYESRPDFIYYSLRKSGNMRSEAFGVADSKSRQFGLNKGDMSAFCHRDGYAFRETLEQLQ